MRISKKLFVSALFVGGLGCFFGKWEHYGYFALTGLFLIVAGFVFSSEWFV